MNETQIEHWNGPEARHWIVEADRYDRQLAPFAAELVRAAAIASTERVLDIGCGCGGTTMLAAHNAAAALGVDISAPMLDHARTRAAAAGTSNVQFEPADAQTYAFAPSSFDVAISRFGVMFFDDAAAAFANVARALRPGGRLVFVCWQELGRNDWLLVPGMAAAQHVPLPDLGPPGGPGMFSLAEPDHVHELLQSAGFVDIEVAPFEVPMLVAGGASLDETLQFLLATGIGRALLADAAPEAAARAVDAARQALAAHHDGVGVRLGAATWVVTACSRT
jgi:SAM-dependent methyltransferase